MCVFGVCLCVAACVFKDVDFGFLLKEINVDFPILYNY